MQKKPKTCTVGTPTSLYNVNVHLDWIVRVIESTSRLDRVMSDELPKTTGHNFGGEANS